MIVDVAFNYRAHLVPPGKRKSEVRDLRDTVSVSIPEAASDEAPVVAWWTAPGCGDTEQVALRHFEGRLYSPVTLNKGDLDRGHPPCKPSKDAEACRKIAQKDRPGTVPIVSRDSLVSGLANGTLSVSGISATRTSYDGDHPTLDQVPHRRVEGSGREAAGRFFNALANELLLVGGTAYRAVPEPVLVVTNKYGEHRVESEYSTGGYKSLAMAFRLDRWEDAKAAWRSGLEELGIWQKGWEKGRNVDYRYKIGTPPDVVRPDLLGLDDVGLAIRHVATRVVEHMGNVNRGGYTSNHGHPVMLSHSRDIALAYAGLRDALKAGDAPADILEGLRTFANEADGVGMLIDQHKEVATLLKRMGREMDHETLAELGAPQCS